MALCFCAVPASILFAAQFSPFLGQVNENKVNLRSDSRANAEAICLLNKADKVEVVSEFYGEWYKIKLPKYAPAFIKKELLACQPGIEPAEACKTAKVIKDNVNIRSGPSEDSAILGHVYKNEIVNVRQEQREWFKIEPPANSFGWVHKKFIQKPEDIAIKSVIDKKQGADQTITVEGVILPYGKVLKRQASHKISTKDNKIYLLKGNEESLNKFNNKRVRIVGKLITASGEKYPLIEIEKMEAGE